MPTADGHADVDSLRILGQRQGFTLSTDSPPPQVVIYLSNVQYGKTNGDIQTVQTKLQAINLNPGPADGYFGPMTLDAWKAWERALAVPDDGVPDCQSLGTLGRIDGVAPYFETNCDITPPPPPPPPSDNEPVHDYTRIAHASTGVTINRRTQIMLDRAVAALADSYSWTPYLTQGSYNPGGVSQSAGTHDGGGVVDIRTSTMSTHGADLCVQALREVGFAAWRRTSAEGFSPHIHAVAIGDREMSSSAANQVQAYFDGRNGLANNGPDTLSSTYRVRWPSWCDKYNY